MTLTGPDLKDALQATVHPIIQINVPPRLLTPKESSTDKGAGEISKIMGTCFP